VDKTRVFATKMEIRTKLDFVVAHFFGAFSPSLPPRVHPQVPGPAVAFLDQARRSESLAHCNFFALSSSFMEQGANTPQEEGLHEHHGQHHHRHGSHHGHSHGNITFEDAERWAEKFEAPGRLAYMQFERLIDQVIRPALLSEKANNKPVVVEIGAGSGSLALRLARLIPEARIIATDIEETMVQFLKQKAVQLSLLNLEVIHSPQGGAAPVLPAPANLAIFCSVYHHLDEKSRVDYLKDLKRVTLAPGGLVVVIEFAPGVSCDFGPPEWMRLDKVKVVDEFTKGAGFTVLASANVAGWEPAMYVTVFGE